MSFKLSASCERREVRKMQTSFDSGFVDPNLTIILAIPSIGNCGQLGLDLILTTLTESSSVVKLGAIESDCLIPMTGREQYTITSPPFLCMPLEVYKCVNKPFLFVQQRSQCFPGRSEKFANDLIKLFRTWEVQRVIIICGASLEGVADEALNRSVTK